MRSLQTLGICFRVSRSLGSTRAISVLSVRSFANVHKVSSGSNVWNGHLRPFNGLESRHASILGQAKAFNKKYSTATAPPPPPPPPPPHDKNAKGKFLLNRITRAFTFSMSSALVLGATAVSVLVVYLILSELFLPSGDTRTFNKAVRMVEHSEAAQAALDFTSGYRLKAHGEVQGDKWARNRPAQTMRSRGNDGKDYLFMKFHVESDNGKHGTVTLEQVDKSFWSSEFVYVALDMPGNKRIYIKEPTFQSKKYVPKVGSINNDNGFLGLKWGPKKDD